jgi:hypothetical protein
MKENLRKFETPATPVHTGELPEVFLCLVVAGLR